MVRIATQLLNKFPRFIEPECLLQQHNSTSLAPYHEPD